MNSIVDEEVFKKRIFRALNTRIPVFRPYNLDTCLVVQNKVRYIGVMLYVQNELVELRKIKESKTDNEEKYSSIMRIIKEIEVKYTL